MQGQGIDTAPLLKKKNKNKNRIKEEKAVMGCKSKYCLPSETAPRDIRAALFQPSQAEMQTELQYLWKKAFGGVWFFKEGDG